MQNQKKQLATNHHLTPTLALSLLAVFAVAGVLRLAEHSTRAVHADELTFDRHYVARALTSGTVGHYGLVADTITVDAVRARAPEALAVDQQPRLLRLAPKRGTTVILFFKNRSKKTWLPTGVNRVTLRLADPAAGALRHRFWKGDVLGRVTKTVRPGETAAIRFAVAGPTTDGFVREPLALYAGNRKLVGSDTTLTAAVGDANGQHLTASIPGDLTLTMDPGAEQRVEIAATNLGHQPWQNAGFARVRLVPTTTPSAFRASRWLTNTIANRLPNTTIAPGKTTTIPLWLKAPTAPGTYTEEFQLLATGVGPISGGGLRITITVPPAITALLFTPQEPMVRVGLFSQTTAPTATINVTGEAQLVTTDGTVLLPAVTQVTLAKDGTAYTYSTSQGQGSSPLPLRVQAPPTTILEIASWDRRPSWNPALNDNLYRGTIEFHTATNGNTWVINELPIESYLRGLAETSGSDALEFRKALLTGARTYALHHWSKKTKHADENYDLNASTDQVYRGYAHELRSPSVAQAVEATRGMVMFHAAARSSINPNGIILAAYSACTDGRTRSFQEVWGGDGLMTPYLVSVADPAGICQTERYRLGLDGNHMVGLSGNGARATALTGGTYDQILLQYYTGVTLAKFYD